jgi:hypothetical protein
MKNFFHNHLHRHHREPVTPNPIPNPVPPPVVTTTTVDTSTLTTSVPKTELQQTSVETRTVATTISNVPETSNVEVQHIEKNPVIHEKIMKEEVEEIQPVVFREHDRPEVHQIVQPIIMDTEVKPTIRIEKELPPEVLPTVTRGSYLPSEAERNTLDVQTKKIVVTKEPIIVDTQKRIIIEEIQPVIYKETVLPTIIHETKPIYETIFEPPMVTHEVREPLPHQPVQITKTITSVQTTNPILTVLPH